MWWSAVALAGSPVTVTPEVGTEFPVSLQAGVRVALPARLRVGAAVGFLPRGYLQVANGAVTAMFPESYTEDTATLVEETLSSSLLLRARVAWQPSPRAGLTVGVGGTLATLGGGATAAELLEGLYGADLPPSRRSEALEVAAAATVGMLDVELGWEITPWRRLQVRPVLGWTFTVAARSRLEAETDRSIAAIETLEREGEAYLDDVLTSYVHPPWIGVHVGWTLGK